MECLILKYSGRENGKNSECYKTCRDSFTYPPNIEEGTCEGETETPKFGGAFTYRNQLPIPIYFLVLLLLQLPLFHNFLLQIIYYPSKPAIHVPCEGKNSLFFGLARRIRRRRRWRWRVKNNSYSVGRETLPLLFTRVSAVCLTNIGDSPSLCSVLYVLSLLFSKTHP